MANAPKPVEIKEDLKSSREESSFRQQSSDNWGWALIVFILFGVFVFPWFIGKRESIPFGSAAIYLVAVVIMAASWIAIGTLFGLRSRANGLYADADRAWGSTTELVLYFVVLVPSSYFVIFWGAATFGTIGFNQVLVFVVVSLAAYIVPVWALALTLVVELALFNFCGQFFLNWRSMSFGSIMGIGSGMAFGCMMFLLLKKEAKSRSAMAKLVSELDEANSQLRAFSLKVENLSAAQERNRIAREIHDTLGHSLTVVNIQLEAADALLAKNDADKARTFVQKAKELNRNGLQDVRASVSSLRTTPLDGKSLTDAVKDLVKETAAPSLNTTITINGEVPSIDDATAIALYRTVQEGLTNIRKHSQATAAKIILNFQDTKSLSITIQDNGIGCDSPEGGFGILGMQERIQFLNGSTRIKTSTGNGFTLEVSVPL